MCPSVSDSPQQPDASAADDSPLARARVLLGRGDPEACGAMLDGIINDEPTPEVHYLQAVCRRYLRDRAGAHAALDSLLALDPEHARGNQERGHLHRDDGRALDAIDAYERAVTLNPALVASWRALAALLAQTGQADRLRFAEAQIRRLESLPRELVSVTSFMHQGQLRKAEKLCRAFLKRNPQHVEAMRLLAALGTKLNILDDAEFLLESALEFEPDYLPARIDYVGVLQKRQKFEKALEEAAGLRRLHPDTPALEQLYANACAAAGRYDDALPVYEREIAREPGDATLRLARGHALKSIGKQDEAIDAYRSAANLRSGFGDAYWSLANLKTYRFSDHELAEMQTRADDPELPVDDRFHLCFALGKALEDRQHYEESFRYYRLGNEIKGGLTGFDSGGMTRDLRLQSDVMTRPFFAEREGWGCPDDDPIFIVGLPRAGSTLLEQILASHSEVDGTLELPNILALVRRLHGRHRIDDDPRYPGILGSLSAEQYHEFGEQYLENTAFHRRGARLFTDKMPNNFRHIGLIHLMLPRAKIIDARREPMACCFSGFKQLFGEGQEFTYGLSEIGQYYRDYVELMDHWDRALPGRVLRVMHEDVVDDLEGQVRRLLDFCGLAFESSCLEFHKTRRTVRTASSEQVRQPINRRGLEQWRAYDEYLDPLRNALGPVLANYRGHGAGAHPANEAARQ